MLFGAVFLVLMSASFGTWFVGLKWVPICVKFTVDAWESLSTTITKVYGSEYRLLDDVLGYPALK